MRATPRRRKILTIFGTRPEAIKLAPVLLELERSPDSFQSEVCVTAQHRAMLDQMLDTFEIEPDHDLDLMVPGQSSSQVTARAVEGLDRVIRDVRPDVVLVQGDTTTAFCGALAAFYNRISVGHVEAGLRTGAKFSPFPEEINRRLLSTLADYHFAATEHAKQALIAEGVTPSSIFVTGNTVIDALFWMRDRARDEPSELPGPLVRDLTSHDMVLVTGHRRESFGEGFEGICSAIRAAADRVPGAVFIYPVHLNPNVREPVMRILGGHPRIHLIPPLSYPAFVWLMSRATVVLTDSGGVQEEAPSLGKPVLVMRETTERPEGVEAGNARVVGVSKETILRELVDLLENPEKRTAMAAVNNPYGDGRAAQRIVSILQSC